MAVKRKDVYRRLALEHVGSESVISEHTIVRAHDRSYPLLIKMFFSNNYGARNFAATDTKVTGLLHTMHGTGPWNGRRIKQEGDNKDRYGSEF